MAKKGDLSNLKDIGLGIMDTLSGIQEEKVKKETADPLNENSIDKITNEGKIENETTYSNTIKEDKSKTVKVTKSKRSFMLTEKGIQRLNLLNLCMTDKDLSTIVEEAINDYFEKNKKSIEEVLSIYNQVK